MTYDSSKSKAIDLCERLLLQGIYAVGSVDVCIRPGNRLAKINRS